MCETKPIMGRGPLGLRNADCGMRIERPGADERVCETKPIRSGQAGGGRPQGITQAGVQNKANLGSRPWECGMRSEGAWQVNESAKQSQLGAEDKGGTPSPRTPYGGTGGFETRPYNGSDSAKQSQFGGCVSLSSLWEKGYDWLAILRNKANSRSGAWECGVRNAECGMKKTGAILRNRANSRPGALGVRNTECGMRNAE